MIDDCQPGPRDPYPITDAAGIADSYAVSTAVVQQWRDAGCPTEPDGGFDPMAVCNWLSWGRLDQAPALARRWRTFLNWFAGGTRSGEIGRCYALTQQRQLLVPHDDLAWQWQVPVPIAHGAVQSVSGQSVSGESVAQAGRSAQAWELQAASAIGRGCGAAELSVTSTVTVQAQPATEALAALVPLVTELVAGFTYGYRRHTPDGRCFAAAGTCLDLAATLRDRLLATGRACRLIAGLIPRDDLANPHYWLEVETRSGGWAVVDPSLPAIARMLDADWQTWIRMCTGGCDARRVVLAVAEADESVATLLQRSPGAVTVTNGGSGAGSAASTTSCSDIGPTAWACQDWVCGACTLAARSVALGG